MVENLKISMKIIVHLLAWTSNFIVCRNSTEKYEKLACGRIVGQNLSTICESYSNKNSILPVQDIPDDTESLIISTSGDGSLAITRADIFKNFEWLKNLEIQISGSLYIDEKLLDSVSMNYLQKVLFNLSNLKNLSLKYNQFNDKSYSWILPANLEKLYLSNGVLEFDLQNCSNLVLVRLNRNKLSKIPSFSDPSSSTLKILDLRLNPLNEFTVNDIASLCRLKYFAMDTSQITNCECNKLKQWIIKLQDWGDFTFGGSLNCNDTIGRYSKCTLEKATLQREEKCSKWWKSDSKAILLVKLGLLGLLIWLICCVICLCVIGFCLDWLLRPEMQIQNRGIENLSPY